MSMSGSENAATLKRAKPHTSATHIACRRLGSVRTGVINVDGGSGGSWRVLKCHRDPGAEEDENLEIGYVAKSTVKEAQMPWVERVERLGRSGHSRPTLVRILCPISEKDSQ